MIALDFYGCGGSPLPNNLETFSLNDEIALVESILDGIIPGNEPFHIVGHSFGGAVGLRLSYGAPEKVRSLTLFEPVAFHLLRDTDDDVLAKVTQVQDTVEKYIQQDNYAAAAEYFIDYYNESGTFASFPKEMQDLLCESAKKLPPGFRALVQEPLSFEDYRNIKIPVCLLIGRQSPINSRRVAELLVDYLPDCSFHSVDGGHMVPLSQPELVNPIIESFIRRNSSTRLS